MTSSRSLCAPSAPRALTAAAAALLLLTTAACGGDDTAAPSSSTSPASSSGASDEGGASPSETTSSESSPSASPTPTAIPASPPPKGFAIKKPCSGEGTYDVRAGAKTSSPSLDPREDATLDIGLTSVQHGKAHLTASLDGGKRRPVEPVEVGSTVSVDLWTLTITSVCQDSVQFDVID